MNCKHPNNAHLIETYDKHGKSPTGFMRCQTCGERWKTGTVAPGSATPNEDEVKGLSWLMRVAAEHAVKWGWSKEHWLRLAAYWWAVTNREDYVDPITGETKEVP